MSIRTHGIGFRSPDLEGRCFIRQRLHRRFFWSRILVWITSNILDTFKVLMYVYYNSTHWLIHLLVETLAVETSSIWPVLKESQFTIQHFQLIFWCTGSCSSLATCWWMQWWVRAGQWWNDGKLTWLKSWNTEFQLFNVVMVDYIILNLLLTPPPCVLVCSSVRTALEDYILEARCFIPQNVR